MTEPHLPPRLIARLVDLKAEIDAIGPLQESHLLLPRSGRTYEVLQPTDFDALLDRVVDDPEQNLPYWAELWPSGIALADHITLEPERVAGRRVLELGSGLGATAAAAIAAGADLTATDYSAESLLLCRYNTLRLTGREPATLRLNWREPNRRLFDLAGPGYPLVLAADVLYESRDVEPLLALTSRLVAPDGLLWLAEPGRPPAKRFLDAARDAGWRIESETHAGPWPDPKDAGVIVGLHRLQPPAGASDER